MECISCKSKNISDAMIKLKSGLTKSIKYCEDCGQVQYKIPVTKQESVTSVDKDNEITAFDALKQKLRDSW